MGEELLVVLVTKYVVKCQTVEVPGKSLPISLEVILVVVDVLTNTVPSDILFVLDLIGEVQNLHTVVVKRIWFCQIYNIEPDLLILAVARNPEEKPLGMPICIYVILQN